MDSFLQATVLRWFRDTLSQLMVLQMVFGGLASEHAPSSAGAGSPFAFESSSLTSEYTPSTLGASVDGCSKFSVSVASTTDGPQGSPVLTKCQKRRARAKNKYIIEAPMTATPSIDISSLTSASFSYNGGDFDIVNLTDDQLITILSRE